MWMDAIVRLCVGKGRLRRDVRTYQNVEGQSCGRQPERDVDSLVAVELEPLRRNGWESHVSTT